MSDQESTPQENEEQQEQEDDVEGHRVVFNKTVADETEEPDVEGHRNAGVQRTIL